VFYRRAGGAPVLIVIATGARGAGF
jgi:hypothetical protein